jgi:hypothetical protein
MAKNLLKSLVYIVLIYFACHIHLSNDFAVTLMGLPILLTLAFIYSLRLGKNDEGVDQMRFLALEISLGILTAVSLLFAAAKDEGHTVTPIIDFMSKIFLILRFPSHTLMFVLMWNQLSDFLGPLFFPGWILNVVFYAWAIEKFISKILPKLTLRSA